MAKDARGLDVSNASPEAIEVINDFTARMLRLDQGVEAILTAADRWPETPMLRIYAASLFLFGQTAEATENARQQLGQVPSASANEREHGIFQGLLLWADGLHLRAVEAFEEVTRRWPADLLTAKFAEFLYYVLGQQHMGARFRAHMERIEPANANDADFLGMAAFASELCGEFAEAESRATRALEIEPRNAWAEHALSHVLIRQGRVAEGRARMETFLPQLEKSMRVVHSHDAWHLALLYLEELEGERMLTIYRDHVWGFAPELVGEQIDAISLLWRAELAGMPMDDRWEEIANHVEHRVHEAFMPFLSAHHVYALARAGRNDATEKLLATVRERSERDDDEARRVWAKAGRTIVEACAKFGAGDRAAAAEMLEPVMPDMTTIGGSDAQDDLFRQTFLRSLQAAGRKADADAYFDRISGGKIRTPLDEALMAA